jgi:ABC-type uncharacterized transport system auxiliary subunit
MMKSVESELSAWVRKVRAAAAAGWLAAAVLCASCGGARPVHYYTLQVPAPAQVGDPRTNYVLGVQQFRAPEPLRDDRIIYYQSPTQLNFYQQHRWDADPATMLSALAQRELQQTGVFAQVGLAPYVGSVDYILRGQVLSFSEVDYQGGVKARVGLRLTLLRMPDRKVAWSAERQVENVVQEQGVPSVVSAINAATKQILDEMIPGIVAQVESDYRASTGKTTQ